MQCWEYLVARMSEGVWYDSTSREEKLEGFRAIEGTARILNEPREQGWELAASIAGSYATVDRLIFKRPRAES